MPITRLASRTCSGAVAPSAMWRRVWAAASRASSIAPSTMASRRASAFSLAIRSSVPRSRVSCRPDMGDRLGDRQPELLAQVEVLVGDGPLDEVPDLLLRVVAADRDRLGLGQPGRHLEVVAHEVARPGGGVVDG